MHKKKPTKDDFLLAWAQALPEGAHFGEAIWRALGCTERPCREIVEWMGRYDDRVTHSQGDRSLPT
jgi:hypothetical protein